MKNDTGVMITDAELCTLLDNTDNQTVTDPAIRAELDILRAAFLTLVKKTGEESDRDASPAGEVHSVSEKMKGLLYDIQRLPREAGDARPTDEDLLMVESLKNEPVFTEIAEALYEQMTKSGIASVADYNNGLLLYDKQRADIIWNGLNNDSKTAAALKRINEILAQSVDKPNAPDIALADIKASFSNLPSQHINAKTPAAILLGRIHGMITTAFLKRMRADVDAKKLPLLKGEKPLEDVDTLNLNLNAAMNLKELDRMAYLDMLANDLGQAQTANPDKAESFFRDRESIPGTNVQNNFGYVYLNEKQAKKLHIYGSHGRVRTFTYYGEKYFAIPWGLYATKKDVRKYSDVINDLASLSLKFGHENNPAGKYYSALFDYLNLPCRSGITGVKGDDFVKAYYEACYKAERAWVEFMRDAEKNGTPFVPIHPFEKYGTMSTKSHDLAVAIVNPAETAVYSEGKKKFTENAREFFKRKGLTEKYPRMIEETMRLLESVVCLSLSSRIYSESAGTIAQNIPNEEDGRKGGMVTLFDTKVAQATLASYRGQVNRKSDPVGGITENFDHDINDWDTFMGHFLMEVLSHELNHNSFKGKEGSYGGDGKGLAIKLIEEAKATSGMGLHFMDSDNLTEEELADLRKCTPLMLQWSIGRLRPALRAQYTSHQYLREGAVMLDSYLKSGILEPVGIKMEDGGMELVSGKELDSADFGFIRLNLKDENLRRHVKLCADFNASLAPVYNECQSFAGEMKQGTVFPDRTDIDTWQALIRICYDTDIAKKEKKGETVADLKAKKDKVVPPADEVIVSQVKALIRYMDFEEPGRLRQAVAKKYGLKPDDAMLDEKVKETQEYLKLNWPQIYIGK